MSTEGKSNACDLRPEAGPWHWNASQVGAMAALSPAEWLAQLNSTAELVRPAVKFEWTPRTCRLHPFPVASPVDFCLALNGRPLLMVGDSLQQQLMLSLAGLLGADGEGVCLDLLDRYLLPILHTHCAGLPGTTRFPDINYEASCRDGQWVNAIPRPLVSVAYDRNDFLSDVKEYTRTDLPNRVGQRSPHMHHTTQHITTYTGTHTVERASHLPRCAVLCCTVCVRHRVQLAAACASRLSVGSELRSSHVAG